MDARDSGLSVAGCDGAKVLDDVEETFDEVALALERKVALARRLAICLGGMTCLMLRTSRCSMKPSLS